MSGLFDRLRHRRMQRALAEDIENHLAEKTAEFMDAGMTEREARLRARREFGNAALIAETGREVWGWMWLERLVQDVRHGARLMARSPGFTSVAILSLALGIGANTAIFGLLDKLAWRMLPVHKPEELRILKVVSKRTAGNDKIDTSFTYPQYELWRDGNRSFQALAGYSGGLRWRDRSTNDEQPFHDAQFVSGNYFEVLGLPAAYGRLIAPADDTFQGAVAVVSYRFWRTALHADPAAIGQQINVNGAFLTVIGVTPPEFFGNVVGRSPELFVPMHQQPAVEPMNGSVLRDPKSGGTTWVSIVGRLRPGISETQAAADLMPIYEAYQVSRMSPANRTAYLAKQRPLPGVVTLESGSRGTGKLRTLYSEPLQAMMALVGIVLLIACANLAGLLLARGNARAREIAVRLAIGAPRSRIVRQLLTESLMLALAGGALGLLFAAWSSRGLLGMLPKDQPPLGLDLTPDTRILAFTFLVSTACALLFGLLPALRATRISRHISKSGRFRLGKGVAAAELALTLPLLAGAGLFIGTLRNLATVDAGFLRRNVLQARFSLDRAMIPRSQWARVYGELTDRVRAIPGVSHASLVNHGLIQMDATSSGPVHFQGYRFQDGESRNLLENYVDTEYFATTGIPLRMGRTFNADDTNPKAQVAVINETLAHHYFAGRNPIGQRFGFGDMADEIEIVGVVGDSKYFSLRQTPLPMAYYPWQQVMPASMSGLLIRSAGDAAGVAAAVSRAVNAVHPDLLLDVKTLATQIDDSIGTERMLAQISGFFGFLALGLTCIGLYGMMAHTVASRTREIGIRIALGALGGDVVWLMVRETLIISAVGLAAGVPLAMALTRFTGTFLFGLKPNDPMVMAGAAVALLAVSLLAAYLPARRASQVDAADTLRYE